MKVEQLTRTEQIRSLRQKTRVHALSKKSVEPIAFETIQSVAMENNTSVQTRAMTEAQCREGGAQRQVDDNSERVQVTNPVTVTGTRGPETQDPARNMSRHKTDNKLIDEFVRKECTIGLNWYVPNLSNTQVGELIRKQLPIDTTQGRILFNCPPPKEYFNTATFKLDLKTGRVYTFLTPPEYIGIPCQEEEFDLDLLTETLEKGRNSDEHQLQEIQRIPLIRKITAPADVMDLEEIEHQIHQYCKLWSLYADTSIELKGTSKLPREDAVTACKMYGTYI